ncbi:hypothetical protein ACQKH5_16755 [Hyphomonas sp. NPDC076900]|uniref:hypothetical protein n=1 Tax=unclassified Hyphomonas TaxID=2630699 RepID=UPI003CFBED9A
MLAGMKKAAGRNAQRPGEEKEERDTSLEGGEPVSGRGASGGEVKMGTKRAIASPNLR